MADITCTITKNGRCDKYGRPLTAGSSYTGAFDEVRSLYLSGFATVVDVSIFDDDSAPSGSYFAPIPVGTKPASVVVDPVTGGIEFSAGETRAPLITYAEREAEMRLSQSDDGTLLTNWSGGSDPVIANGTPVSGSAGRVTSDTAPTKDSKGYALRLIGDASTRWRVSKPFTAQSTAVGFSGVMFWCKVKGRTATPVPAQLWLGATDDPYAGKALATTIALPADGKWHKVFIPKGTLSAQNSFVIGTDTIQSFGLVSRQVADGSLGTLGMLVNTEELQLGPLYINPFSRAKFLIRMDDSLSDTLVANPAITFAADGITQSWSHHSLMSQFGFGSKGSCFHLSRRFNTSNYGATFLTDAQLETLAGYGWSHCTQTHQDPGDASSPGKGVLLMGPFGYADRTVSAVANATDTLTSAAHKIPVGTAIGYAGYPIIFAGSDLPAPLVAGTVYWARGTTVNDFKVFATENDSLVGSTPIDLTTYGSGTITYRYAYSANDYTLVRGDFDNCIAALTARGYGETAKIYSPNQGCVDQATLEAAFAAGIDTILGIGNTGASYDAPYSRHLHVEVVGGVGGDTGNRIFDSRMTVPSAFQTDGSPTAANARTYVRAVIATGGIGSNFHHKLTATNGPVLAAYLDELRTAVAEGGCDVVTAKELRDYLAAARRLVPGVIF